MVAVPPKFREGLVEDNDDGRIMQEAFDLNDETSFRNSFSRKN